MVKPIAASIPFTQALLYIWKGRKVFVLYSKGLIPERKQPSGGQSTHGFVTNYICAMGLVSSLENELVKSQKQVFILL